LAAGSNLSLMSRSSSLGNLCCQIDNPIVQRNLRRLYHSGKLDSIGVTFQHCHLQSLTVGNIRRGISSHSVKPSTCIIGPRRRGRTKRRATATWQKEDLANHHQRPRNSDSINRTRISHRSQKRTGFYDNLNIQKRPSRQRLK
jgi:hypothetical protein